MFYGHQPIPCQSFLSAFKEKQKIAKMKNPIFEVIFEFYVIYEHKSYPVRIEYPHLFWTTWAPQLGAFLLLLKYRTL